MFTLIVKLEANVFRPECAVKHHFEASLCDNSNIKVTLFNLKFLKPFVYSLFFKLHTHCEETTAASFTFSTNAFNLSRSWRFTTDFYKVRFFYLHYVIDMVIYSVYCQFKKHTGSGTCKHLSKQNCKQKSKLVSCHFTLNLFLITQSKKCTNSSPEILKFLSEEEFLPG